MKLSKKFTILLLVLALAPPVIAQDSANSTDDRVDLLFWSSIQDSDNVDMYEAYLSEFPDGKFATLAKLKIRSLGGTPAPGDTERPSSSSPEPEAPATSSTVTSAAVEPQNLGASAETMEDCSECPSLVLVSGSRFIMGSNNSNDSASPPHTVSIDYDFWIGRYEVTRQEWNLCVSEGGCEANPRNSSDTDVLFDRRPAFNISWQDAIAYVEWISDYTGETYRLPTEAEWEFSARAGTDTTYWWGDTYQSAIADCRDCGGFWDKKQPAVADGFLANPFGLHNTAGGVSEWVQDCWFDTYANAPTDGFAREKTDCVSKVLRGGSWRNKTDYLTSANRLKYDFNVRYITNGFRVVREP